MGVNELLRQLAAHDEHELSPRQLNPHAETTQLELGRTLNEVQQTLRRKEGELAEAHKGLAEMQGELASVLSSFDSLEEKIGSRAEMHKAKSKHWRHILSACKRSWRL